jgi:hypothetical protein
MEFRHNRVVGLRVFGDGIALQVANRQSLPTFQTGSGVNEVIAAVLHTAISFSRGTFRPVTAAPVNPPETSSREGQAPTHQRPSGAVGPRRSLMEVLEGERLHPGSNPQNTTWVPGAVSHQSTPEADIVQPEASVAPSGETFIGGDPRADDEARRILDHLRSFSDHDSIDGPNGLATQWAERLITLQELRGSYKRYLDLKDLVHQFMTPSDEAT